MGQDSPAGLLLREFRMEDIGVLHRIDAACFEPGISFTRAELLFHLTQPGAVSRVAESGGLIVGFAIGCRPDESSGYVVTLDVIREMRRKTVGRALLEALHSAFRRAGAGISYLDVDRSNTGARAFYLRLGYVPVEILKGYYRGERDAVRMVRELA